MFYSYSNVVKEDNKTNHFKKLITEKCKGIWRNIYGYSTSSVATIISNDHVDILVELAVCIY